ncbi:MAG: chromosome partitioning protein ParB, partial [Candidatus Omnitrophica bacterium]|nr:chromosome partitioning protein ParB [Candidatus Omnitrophota bacterium]
MVSKLGRGLGSLIVETATASDKSKENVELLQLKELIPNTYQPRKDFDNVKMEELMSSI